MWRQLVPKVLLRLLSEHVATAPHLVRNPNLCTYCTSILRFISAGAAFPWMTKIKVKLRYRSLFIRCPYSSCLERNGKAGRGLCSFLSPFPSFPCIGWHAGMPHGQHLLRRRHRRPCQCPPRPPPASRSTSTDNNAYRPLRFGTVFSSRLFVWPPHSDRVSLSRGCNCLLGWR